MGLIMNEQFIIRKLLKSKIKGFDNYKHNGSTWLIFTSEKKWAIELTSQGTLWYNYYFFNEIFNFVGLDVIENQHIITEWVEETIINPVKKTRSNQMDEPLRVEDTIQNGVKNIKYNIFPTRFAVEDTIQNGVKHTEKSLQIDGSCVIEDTIQNGVKHTQGSIFDNPTTVKDTIQNGVKYTGDRQGNYNLVVEDTIQNGIKETNPHFLELINPINFETVIEEMKRTNEVNIVLNNGIKETTPGGYLGFVERKGKTIHQFETAKQLYYVEDVIEYGIKKTEGAMLFDESQIDTVISDGIKEVQPLPSQEGNKDWGIYYHRQEVPTKPHTQYVDDVVRDGVKETSWRKVDNYPTYTDNVIERGEKC